MSRFRKLSHTIWHCHYHIVWVPEVPVPDIDGTGIGGSRPVYPAFGRSAILADVERDFQQMKFLRFQIHTDRDSHIVSITNQM